MSLSTRKELSNYYFTYLQERGTKDAMKEFLQIDRELNGPLSVQPDYAKPITSGKGLENGHAPIVDEATLRKGEARYSNYYAERRDVPPNAQGTAPFA